MHIHQRKGLTPSNDIGQSSNHMEDPIYSDPHYYTGQMFDDYCVVTKIT